MEKNKLKLMSSVKTKNRTYRDCQNVINNLDLINIFKRKQTSKAVSSGKMIKLDKKSFEGKRK